ncbi:hypothetical protein NDN08_006391 [Rhodosorus marinus]|uniref:Translocation and assembly module TamB C-terminal domain-containing protein n=1 Tax=Rhodosorus marinus TaxID=101924 RepID=A0AAV8UNN8_9RHOD|nr:hypothetical protein NDN08_006391 [Rhodosorus marinus]
MCARVQANLAGRNRQDGPPARLFQSWKSPNWAYQSAVAEAENVKLVQDRSLEEFSVELLLIASSRLYTALSKVSLQSVRKWTLRGMLSLTVLSSALLLWIGYFRVQENIAMLTFGSLSQAMNREVNLGRLRRLSFFGLCFGKTSLANYIPAKGEIMTKPDVSIDSIDVEVVGFFPFLFKDETLKVNLNLHRPVVALRQSLEPDNHFWDLGIPLTGADATQRRERIKRYLTNEIVRPGKVSLDNANVKLTPSGHFEFGHGRVTQELRGVRGDIDFDAMVVNASAEGLVSDDGGKINASCFCDLDSLVYAAGSTLLAAPEGITVQTNVKMSGLSSSAAAGFLNLPFRATEGVCNGNLNVTFGRDLIVPKVDGDLFLESINLVFHPDPKMPPLSDCSGRLRFDTHEVFFESPTAVCGTIPMFFDGSIDFQGDYKLSSQIRPMDVNSLLDTFQMERFFPVEGMFEGLLQMRGPLEAPIMTGRAHSTVEDNIVDKMDVRNATAEIYWDISSGRLQFPNIKLDLLAGGVVTGNGTLSFDMTKFQGESSAEPRDAIPGEPEDIFQVDPYALERPSETILFNFYAKNVPGCEVMRKYGGKQGLKGLRLFGDLEGEVVVGGPMKEAVVEAKWKSSGSSPVIFLSSKEDQEMASRNAPADGDFQAPGKGESSEEESPPQVKEGSKAITPEVILDDGQPLNPEGPIPDTEKKEDAELDKEKQAKTDAAVQTLPEPPTQDLRKTDDSGKPVQGNGASPSPGNVRAESDSTGSEKSTADAHEAKEWRLRGEVNTDAEESVTVKDPRTEILAADIEAGLQLSRRQVEKKRPRPELRLRSNPLVRPAGEKLQDSEVHGTVSILLGDAPEERRIRAKTYVTNIDGRRIQWEDEQVRETVLRNVYDARIAGIGYFEGVMRSTLLPHPIGRNGEVRYRQQQMKLKNIDGEVWSPNLKLNDLLFERGLKGRFYLDEESMQIDLNEKLKPTGDRFKIHSTTAGKGALYIRWNDSNLNVTANAKSQSMFARVESFPMHNLLGSNSQIEGVLHSNLSLNMKTRRGNASVRWEKARVGDLYLDNLEMNVFWVKELVSLDKCLIKQPNSEYRALGELSFPGGDFSRKPAWKARITVPEAEVNEFVELLCGKVDKAEDAKQTLADWSVPKLEMEDKLGWFENFLDEETEHEVRLQFAGEKVDIPEPLPYPRDMFGTFSGAFDMESNGELSATGHLDGKDWRVGQHMIGTVSARASLKDGMYNVKNVDITGEEGLSFHAHGQLGTQDDKDSVTMEVDAENIPSQSFLQHVKHRFNLDANLNFKGVMQGTIYEPEVVCEFSIPEGIINDKAIESTKGSFSYRNVRADVKLDGKVFDVSELKKPKYRRREEKLNLEASVPYRMPPIEVPGRNGSRKWTPDQLQQPLPTDYITVDGQLKKHGLLVMNLLAPDLTWTAGNSDLKLKVRGTLGEPKIDGYGNVSDGELWPEFLEDPLRRVRFEVVINRGQVVSVNGFSGSYNGRPLTIYGELPLIDPSIKIGTPLTLNSAEVMLNVREYYFGKASGKVSLAGSAKVPTLSGRVVLREGVVYVQNYVQNSETTDGKTGEQEGQVVEVGPALGLNGVDVKFQNDLSVVFPYVMNVGVEGGIKLNGDSSTPMPTGRVDLTDGTINLVTTRLKVKRDSNNYAVFSGDLMPLVEFTLENQGLTMHVRQTRADKWSSALEVKDKSSDNSLDERHWIGVVADRLRGMSSSERLGESIPDFATKTFVTNYSLAGELGDARWRLYPSIGDVVHPRGAVRLEELGVAAVVEQDEAKLNFSASLNGFAKGVISFRPTDVLSLNMQVTPNETTAQLEINYKGDRKRD